MISNLGLILICSLVVEIYSISCSSNEYCPSGWTVRRREDGSAVTCDPMDRNRPKCGRPFMCIASKCGLKFCCSSDKMANEKPEEEEGEEEENVAVDATGHVIGEEQTFRKVAEL